MKAKIHRNLSSSITHYVSSKNTNSVKNTAFKDAIKESSSSRRVRDNAGKKAQIAAEHHPRPKKLITMTQAQRLARYAPVISEASNKYKVPVELICGVILQESGGNYKAVSHCGARGLMQLMPATAKRMGVTNSFDPAQNIMGGTKYLRFLLDRFDGNIALAVAGYNAGEGNVEKYGRKIPPFKETRAYVPNVMKYADTIWSMLRNQPVTRVAAGPAPDARSASPIYHRTIYIPLKRV